MPNNVLTNYENYVIVNRLLNVADVPKRLKGLPC